MTGMVFAAGLGTRLRPITDSIPKALVPVGGVPMLERVIRKMAAAGIAPVVVNTHHFADKVKAFISGGDFGVPVLLSIEDGAEALETGGGIKRAAPLLGAGRFLVHNTDILSDISLPWFIGQDDPSSLATLLLVDRPADRKLLFVADAPSAGRIGGPAGVAARDHANGRGPNVSLGGMSPQGEPVRAPMPPEGGFTPLRMVGWTNTVTGEVRSPYPDLDPGKCLQYSFCGIQILSDRVFCLMEPWPERFGIMDFYISSCRDHLIRGVLADGVNLIDIGTPESLRRAEEAVSAGAL